MPLFHHWRNNSKSSHNKTDPNIHDDDSSSQTASSVDRVGMAGDVALSALRVVADVMPFPPACDAVNVAIRIIELCQGARTALKQVDELRGRVRALSLVVAHELSGKSTDQISERLKKDLEQFQSKLDSISKELKKISERNRLVNILLKYTNEQAVERCLMNLDNALGNFELVQSIKNTETLETLERKVELASGALYEIRANAKETKQDIGEVKRPRKPHFPPLPATFCGREELVERLATKFVRPRSAERGLVTILGSGGMGKTLVGVAVMEHPSVCKCFGDNRFWVSCEKAESVSLLLDTLYEALCIKKQSGKTLDDILDELSPPDHPNIQPFRVLLLDNFETPLRLRGQERTEVENILRSLMGIRRLSILVTMRANQAPVEGWEEELITSLSPKASIEIYKSIDPRSSDNLSELLTSLGHLPLAVTLIARYAKTNDATPIELLEVLRCQGITYLEGQDNRISTSIELSIKSPAMIQNPDALRLLALLSFLPAGVPKEYLRHWMPSTIDQWRTLSTLNTTALIEKRDDLVVVIPVIRSYVLNSGHIPRHILDEARVHVHQLSTSFLAQHKPSPGDFSYLGDKEFISKQEMNFRSVLWGATSDPGVNASPEVLEALLTLCWHQIWTRPRLELIEHTLSLSERADNKQYIARSLACYGEMCIVLARLKDAIKHLTQAHNEFIKLGDKVAAADCSIRLLEARMHHDPSFEDDLFLVQRAGLEYGTSSVGEALRLLYEGKVYWQKGDRDHDALHALDRAEQKLRYLSKPFELAHCLYFLSRTYHRRRDLENALQFAQKAVDLYQQCGYGEYIGRSLIHLSNVLKDREDYDDALRRAHEALDVWSSLGSSFGVAQALHQCGSVLLAMGDLAAARNLLSRALEGYNSDDQDSYARRILTTRCKESLDMARKGLDARDAYERASIRTTSLLFRSCRLLFIPNFFLSTFPYLHQLFGSF